MCLQLFKDTLDASTWERERKGLTKLGIFLNKKGNMLPKWPVVRQEEKPKYRGVSCLL